MLRDIFRSTAVLSAATVLRPGEKAFYGVTCELPEILPPSFRGTSVRYTYHLRVSCLQTDSGLTAEERATGDAGAAHSAHAAPSGERSSAGAQPAEIGTAEELGAGVPLSATVELPIWPHCAADLSTGAPLEGGGAQTPLVHYRLLAPEDSPSIDVQVSNGQG